MENRKVLVVLFGGKSGEHEVSIRSASCVIREADKSKYRVIPIAVSKEGRWQSPAHSLTLLSREAIDSLGPDADALSADAYTLGPDSGTRSLVCSNGNLPIAIDVVFPVIHGTHGEDGTLQGLLDLADVPYVGCGVLASANGMDKVFMKRLFTEADLPICRYRWITRSDWETDMDREIGRIEELGYPCFVKPANLGSSVGVSRAKDREELIAAVEFAANYDHKVIIEECLEMREIECAVLGNDDVKASLPGEYVVKDETKRFLDYTEKYGSTGNNEFVVPAHIDEETALSIQEMAVRAFRAIDATGLARVDFFLLGDGRLYVNEINTMPGLTDASGYPKMWQASELPMRTLIDALVELAFSRHEERGKNKTSI